jgi:inosose dehydratase
MSFLDRIAGAPISWGVDGSPGWGHLMNRDRVMQEMVDVGLRATELGPDGYLPLEADELVQYVGQYGLTVVGGFVPAVLYRPDLLDEQLAYARRAAHQLAAGGAKILVLGPATAQAGYDQSFDLDSDEWKAFFANLERLRDVVADEGLGTALHPHWGMVIEKADHIDRFLNSCDVDMCLDTGHVFLGGADPAAIAKDAASRVSHVHLKDVDGEFAERVQSGELAFRQGTIDGMFTALGKGAVDIAGVIRNLESAGFSGWYVLEQDKVLDDDPAPSRGPVIDAELSVEFLRELEAELT